MENRSINLETDSSLSIVLSIGYEVLKTKEFSQGLDQLHHLGTSVSKHSFRVALLSVSLAKALYKRGISVDLTSLVRAALLHDFGILGRYEGKFYGIKSCCLFQHPKDSVKVAQSLFFNMTQKEVNTIASHMWPFSASLPCCKEAWIVNLSDKLVGSKEGLEGFYLYAKHRVSPKEGLPIWLRLQNRTIS